MQLLLWMFVAYSDWSIIFRGTFANFNHGEKLPNLTWTSTGDLMRPNSANYQKSRTNSLSMEKCVILFRGVLNNSDFTKSWEAFVQFSLALIQMKDCSRSPLREGEPHWDTPVQSSLVQYCCIQTVYSNRYSMSVCSLTKKIRYTAVLFSDFDALKHANCEWVEYREYNTVSRESVWVIHCATDLDLNQLEHSVLYSLIISHYLSYTQWHVAYHYRATYRASSRFGACVCVSKQWRLNEMTSALDRPI